MVLKMNQLKKEIYNEIYRTESHIYIKPHILLSPYVAHYTILLQQKMDGGGEVLNVLPDASGCIVFDMYENVMKSYIWGPSTASVAVEKGAKTSHIMVFIEFLPGGFYGLMGVPQAQLKDKVYCLKDVDMNFYCHMLTVFQSEINVEDFVAQMESFLLRYLIVQPSSISFSYIIDKLNQPDGSMSVKKLSEFTCYSERHLNRIFKEHIGMSVKHFMKIIRINSVVHSMQGTSTAMVELAQKAGYYDQPHFIHDFQSVCGVTPKEYKLNLNKNYNEPIKLKKWMSN